MHVYLAGIGGAGIGPLAEVAHQLGYKVSGSALDESPSFGEMRGWRPPVNISIGQTADQIAAIHSKDPVDWYVYSSALAWANPPNAELAWVKQSGIKHSKRDEFISHLLKVKGLDLLAVAGSHGKTTTTAMMIWALNQLGEQVSYSLGGKLAGMPAGQFVPGSRWFIYEADEFDRNFLAFHPSFSLITGIDHDHPEVYKTEAEFVGAFCQFVDQSERVVVGRHDFETLKNSPRPPASLNSLEAVVTDPPDPRLILEGVVNRQNASLVLAGAKRLGFDEDKLVLALNSFPGSWRRFERLAPNLYTDYAHSPVKIVGCLQRAREIGKPVVLVYEPHSNQRQHRLKDQYRDLFVGVKKVYWLPTFLTREDPALEVLSSRDLISELSNPQIAQPAQMDSQLLAAIKTEMESGSIVVGMSASGLDSWLRDNLADKKTLQF